MSTAAQNQPNRPQNAAQEQPAAFLTPAEVAAIARRHQRYPVPPEVALSPLCDDDGQEWPCDAAALLAQDARWRALVTDLVWALQLRHDHACLPTETFEAQYGQYLDGDIEEELSRALTQAQAALADAPPPTRGAAE